MTDLFWGFILTKWYVNKNETRDTKKVILSFILTKWYVNLIVHKEI
ncbi:hypothetical protein QEW_0385 [Clostridioides difficile CD160]|nr:hypothetical protein QEW_0385 [Clostridioides difficile CD160]